MRAIFLRGVFVGILSFYREWKKKRQNKAIESQGKVVLNPKTLHEERAAAIDFFLSVDDAAKAVPILLKRFDFSLDHGINDSREKDAAMDAILKHGRASLELVRAHLLDTSRIAWPLKIIQKVGSEQEMVDALESCLDFGDNDFDRSRVDRNYDILCYLRDFSLADKGKNLLPFLKVHDERLRFATVEVLLAQGDQDLISEFLEPFMLDTSAENIRLRQAIIEYYISNQWVLRNPIVPVGVLPESNLEVKEDRRLHILEGE